MPEKRKKKNLKSSKHHAARKPKKAVVSKKVKKAEKKAEKRAARKPVAAAVKTDGSLSVCNLKGKSVGTLTLDSLLNEGPVNTDVLYQAILQYRAGEREGTASTKDRGHVRGGGKKPWKQKGTGRARHGSRRSPLWRGGGTTFGPMPRDYSYSIPRQIRRSAVIEALKSRIREGKLYLVNHLELPSPKTAQVVEVMEALKLQKPLLVVEKHSQNLTLASRNLKGVAVKTALEINALDVAAHRECVMTEAAYTGLVKRFKKS